MRKWFAIVPIDPSDDDDDEGGEAIIHDGYVVVYSGAIDHHWLEFSGRDTEEEAHELGAMWGTDYAVFYLDLEVEDDRDDS